eukprot:COSAG05_NODE_2635_length_2817_cov_1.632082_4_plen_83_part_00
MLGELKQALHWIWGQHGTPIKDEQVDAVFSRLDTDGDGSLSLDEFATAMSPLLPKTGRSFEDTYAGHPRYSVAPFARFDRGC